MTEKKEMSQLARQLLGGAGAVTLFTQQEFDDAITIAKAEIMTVAIETSKKVILIERQACAEVVLGLASDEDEGEVATALKNAAEAILNRIPSQRQ
jgi:NAD(P)H-hydrate repair Nnr-like enzyme with NAD(P)H-hydrate dehydratase domain